MGSGDAEMWGFGGSAQTPAWGIESFKSTDKQTDRQGQSTVNR